MPDIKQAAIRIVSYSIFPFDNSNFLFDFIFKRSLRFYLLLQPTYARISKHFVSILRNNNLYIYLVSVTFDKITSYYK